MSAPSLQKEKVECRDELVEAIVQKISKLNSKGNLVDHLLNGDSGQQWILKIDWKQKSLTSVPQFRPEYQFCTTLNLSGNNLEGGIEWLNHLKRLEFLDLSHNKFTHVADVCGSALTLEHVNLSHNLLKDLPEWILLLEKVKILNLGYNPLGKTSHGHLKKAKWKSIEICYLENLNLVSIPDCLECASNLKELYLGNARDDFNKPYIYESNSIWKMPTLPSSISKLDISNVYLANLEYNWKHLANLKELKARGNDLFWPSEDFPLLARLEAFDLSSCKLFLLPKDIGCLYNLSFVNLSFNKLNCLPKSVELLHNLNHLDLYHSGIENVECNLVKLTRLVKCDLWMNFIDPESILPNHQRLCDGLREILGTVEKKNRLNERVRPSTTSSDDDVASREHLSETEFEEEDDPRELTALSTGTGVEESWDDNVFSDQEPDEEVETKPYNRGNIASKSKDNNVHYFLPAQLHASACSLPPNQFQIIQGQFDDVDEIQ